MPGGGTTDYAVEIYHEAIKSGTYECFLSEDTELPMMFMQDAIKATIELMQTSSENIKVRSAYNLAAISFTPKQVFESIKKYIPDFTISYKPDFRQVIANSWPSSIDDNIARKEWDWQHDFDLDKMTREMIDNLQKQICKVDFG